MVLPWHHIYHVLVFLNSVYLPGKDEANDDAIIVSELLNT